MVTSLEIRAVSVGQRALHGPSGAAFDDGEEPKKIAWLQCVGSRSVNRTDNGYCSNVCCMYAIKQALVTAEHLHGDDAAMTIFNMDIRSHGKEFERYYENAREKGVRFIKARPHSFMPGTHNRGAVMTYAFTEAGEQVTEPFDMVVLSIGLEVQKDAGGPGLGNSALS